MSKELSFNKGDIIEYCNDYFKVIEGGKLYGTVIECNKYGKVSKYSTQICKFYWEVYGETCKLIKEANNETN